MKKELLAIGSFSLTTLLASATPAIQLYWSPNTNGGFTPTNYIVYQGTNSQLSVAGGGLTNINTAGYQTTYSTTNTNYTIVLWNGPTFYFAMLEEANGKDGFPAGELVFDTTNGVVSNSIPGAPLGFGYIVLTNQ